MNFKGTPPTLILEALGGAEVAHGQYRRVLLTGELMLACGLDAGKSSWRLIVSLWPLIWIEWTRASIRRPKQLYL